MPSKTFFTSDHHYRHANVIEYSSRPFKDVDEMSEKMIEAWNSTVAEDDTVYHLGDVTLAGFHTFSEFVGCLNGNVFIVPGGHDYRWISGWRPMDKVTLLPPLVSVEFENGTRYPTVFVLCHYAMRVWDRSHYGAYHLYGHSHGNLPGVGRSMDVGVDAIGYAPIELDDVISRLKGNFDEQHHKSN